MGPPTAIFFAPPPGALGKGQMVIYNLISITKSILKMFIRNFVCVLAKHIRQDFYSVAWGMPYGVGLGGA